MKSLKYILVISALILLGEERAGACGTYFPDAPNYILMFRSCSPELERQWQEGCRFQDYEKDENSLLWQKITSSSIPTEDIKKLVYTATLSDLVELPGGSFANNKFAQWLCKPGHEEDLEYIMIAKEIEEIREYMNNPWYYAYDGDREHGRLDDLMKKCSDYKGRRHAARYALQMIRLYFAKGDFSSCVDLWEKSACKLPRDIVTDMIASYVGGAYSRGGNRDKAIELFTRSQDIGSLISLKAWDYVEDKSEYTDTRVKELEYIFNRFPNSPLLSVKLQKYVRDRESFVYNYEEWKDCGFVADAEPAFYNELKRFAKKAAVSARCHQKGMWNYALSYLYYLDGDLNMSMAYLNRAEYSEGTPFIKESIKAFRFLMDAQYANNSGAYTNKLQRDLKWLDEKLSEDVELAPENNWQDYNRLNESVCYWQDVARKVLLGVVCPKMRQAGNCTLALQLANYASNRIYQLSPLYKAYHFGYDDSDDKESYYVILPFDEYRKIWTGCNYFDYTNQFFEFICDSNADDAAKYAQRIANPRAELDKFLNERSYVDADYINDIVGTLYLREVNYDKASAWLAKVSADYQSRTNVGKEGYFKLDPFRYHFDKKHFISDSRDYKLRFAQEMERLGKMINSDTETNQKAEAKIRYATGLRNSFGQCWYLTAYGYQVVYITGDDFQDWEWYNSSDREGFKDNPYAQCAYEKVDALMNEALAEFTDREKAARAQLEMMNYATVMKEYPTSEAAAQVRSRCDNYYDYSLQKR